MRLTSLTLVLIAFIQLSCQSNKKEQTEKVPENAPFMWEAANVYFMLTDRFNNGDPTNDINFDRNKIPGPARGFEGGDLKGIIAKLEEGYFEDLGINVLWFTPVVEQIHGMVDEGTGPTYAYHGYWAKDWTTLDPNFGTEEDLAHLIDMAHSKGIRVLLDVVVNHTGPVTEKDPVWGDKWVRKGPVCQYKDYETTTSCTLVENLPDILTESDAAVELPDFLKEKWSREGRLEQEEAELDLFFEETGLPRAPRFYIMKWLTDMIRNHGVDGFRVDTAKHTEAVVWKELYEIASPIFEDWKKSHPKKALDNSPFFMVGEVYNYNISSGRWFDYGDKKVDFFAHGFKSLINFEFKNDANKPYDSLFSKYDSLLSKELKNKSILNYVSSHDDGSPFDPNRIKPYETANKLLLTPGASQVYYGDETARKLKIKDAQGDANLRSFMNWDSLATDKKTINLHRHWQKLGTFRRDHPAIGAGKHLMLSEAPYVFSRTLETPAFSESVVVGLELPKGSKSIPTGKAFKDGERITDHYSGNTAVVNNGIIVLDTPYTVVLLY